MQVDMVENIGFAAAACTGTGALAGLRDLAARPCCRCGTCGIDRARGRGHSHEGYRGGSPTGPLGDLASPRGISDSQPENRRPIIG